MFRAPEFSLAAAAIAGADALVIAAGAGMGVDSGLPDFRGREGFWRAYPALEKLGLAFEEIANPIWFERDPTLAWGFYGHRLLLYRATVLHPGFTEVLQWIRGKTHGGFVFTSNVDGQFQRAGFAEGQVAKCHGSIQHWQCTDDCLGRIWAAPAELPFTVDSATCRAGGALPKCPHCGALARPNILMFGDDSWQSHRTQRLDRAFDVWLETQALPRVTVIELGAGLAVPTVRSRSETLQRAGATLIRINPREAFGPTGTISLACGALEGLNGIANAMRR